MKENHKKYDKIITANWGFKLEVDGFNSLFNKLEILLNDFVYYPIYEWGKFKIVPPDATLMYSWRDRDGEVFIFLLQDETNNDFIINAIGIEKQVTNLNNS